MHSMRNLRPVIAVICGVVLALFLSWAGPYPIGGDPDLMYKPIKSELARSLATGSLPFWSHHFGIGVPLVAESHVAAFYPPNWLLYRIFDVHSAYPMAMWLHWFALAATTYAYARTLGITQSGSALAAVSFCLCGFQAVHIVHEPFYYLMPYMPLCLLLAHRYMTSGKFIWIPGLALAWGTQLTLGHFQIQMWTAGLVILSGIWQVWANGENRRRMLWRVAGLFGALVWALLIAWVQLQLTWELTRVSGFERPAHLLERYSFPPAHWAQFALPEVFLGVHQGIDDGYWGRQVTIAGEACAYAGVVVWILGFVGAVAKRSDEDLRAWRVLVPLSLALATMPGWWPDGFLLLMNLPGLGWFRAPARYTLLTCLGLALLAGRGLDRTIPPRRFWMGLALATVAGAVAWCWSIYWTGGVEFQKSALAPTLLIRFAAAGLTWIFGLAVVIAWRQNRLGAWAPLAVLSLELALLLFVGPVTWVWPGARLEASPVLRRLAQMEGVGLVGGRLQDLPVVAGVTTAYPYLGITPPPPNYLLERATSPPSEYDGAEIRWFRRLGLTHGVWGSADDVSGTKVLETIDDPWLDRLMATIPTALRGGLGPWRIAQVAGAFPPAWIAHDIHEAKNWKQAFYYLSLGDRQNEAWFEPGDAPPDFPPSTTTSARVKSWDGTVAVVEHNGPCILILRRVYYPGWSYQLDDGSKRPVLKVNCGLQGVPLLGAGTQRITLQYGPTGLVRAVIISVAAVAIALIVLLATGIKAIRSTLV